MNSKVEPEFASVKEALERFYRDHQLGEDGGENDRWAKVRVGLFSFYIPNVSARKRALFFHDVHHLATGYQTDLRGESEIGAWEVASGCNDYWAAWILDYSALLMGILICPRRTFQAFLRGRNSLNLYRGMMMACPHFLYHGL